MGIYYVVLECIEKQIKGEQQSNEMKEEEEAKNNKYTECEGE